MSVGVLTEKVTSLETNCYTVFQNNVGFVIDPGAEADVIYNKAVEKGIKIEAILLTHGHFDHVGAVSDLQKLTGAKIYISNNDAELANSFKNLSFALGGVMTKFTADVLVKEGEYEVAGMSVRVIETPGHTSGGVCYLTDGKLFSGDTLFCLSYGRTDFPTGDFESLKTSIIGKLFTLDDCDVYPGHGETTRLEYEKKNNPILYD